LEALTKDFYPQQKMEQDLLLVEMVSVKKFNIHLCVSPKPKGDK